MFLFIMFLVYSSSIFDIVMIDNEFMHKIAKRLIKYSSELSGRHYVSMVYERYSKYARVIMLYMRVYMLECMNDLVNKKLHKNLIS
jgi:hypothetical protein